MTQSGRGDRVEVARGRAPTSRRLGAWKALRASLVGALALAGCDPSPGTDPAAPGSAASAPPSASGAAQAPLIDACQRYVQAMEACIAKLPEAERGPRSEALAASKRAWAEPAESPQALNQRETACRAALAAVEQSPCP